MFSADFKAEAVQLVASQGGPAAHAARDLGLNEGKLGNWVLRWKQDHAGDVEEEPLTPTERAELARLCKEDATLRMERELLEKLAAFCVTEMNR
jgi:transposase-like protein